MQRFSWIILVIVGSAAAFLAQTQIGAFDAGSRVVYDVGYESQASPVVDLFAATNHQTVALSAVQDARRLPHAGGSRLWDGSLPSDRTSSGTRSFTTGIGLAFETDPSGGDPVAQPIYRLKGDGSRLDGKFVRVFSLVFDPDGLPTPSSGEPGEFFFDYITGQERECSYDPTKCSQFDNVNAYVHIDRFANDYWQNALGFEVDFQVTVRTHSRRGGTVTDGDTVTVGHSDHFLDKNAWEDDILYHEYVHVGLSHVGFVTDTTSATEHSALGEGYADYFALSFLDTPYYARWATRCPPRFECAGPEDDTEIRKLSTDPALWNWGYGDPDLGLKYGVCTRFHCEDLKCKTTYHTSIDQTYVWGMIWGSTLWDIRSALGNEIADQLVATSLRQYGDQISTFRLATGAILNADEFLFDGAHEERLKEIFRQREIEAFLNSVSIADYVQRQNDGLAVHVFPNPFTSTIDIEVTSIADSYARVRMFDIAGQEVYSSALGRLVPDQSATYRIALPELATGIYVLNVETESGSVSETLVNRK